MTKYDLSKRFAGLLPVVLDLETSGLEPKKNAVLEIAAVPLLLDEKTYKPETNVIHYHVDAYEGATIDEEALKINKIIPNHPFRYAISEQEVIKDLDQQLKVLLKQSGCRKVVWVGHNIWFDLAFMNAMYKRESVTPKHYHHFVTIDTASLSAVHLSETVLAKALNRARIHFDHEEAHSALYDAQKTAELFCYLLNKV